MAHENGPCSELHCYSLGGALAVVHQPTQWLSIWYLLEGPSYTSAAVAERSALGVRLPSVSTTGVSNGG